MKAPVSVCILARDDETSLESTLRSIKPFVSEIVVVDTGSVDATPEIARRYADVCVRFTECNDEELTLARIRGDKNAEERARTRLRTSPPSRPGSIWDFAMARAESFRLATQPWVMWLDADDELRHGDQLRAAIEAGEKHADGQACQIFLPYEYAYDGDGLCTELVMRERLVNRRDDFGWIMPVHEVMAFVPSNGRTLHQLNLDNVVVSHRRQYAIERGKRPEANRNLRILRRWYAEKKEADVRMLHYYSRELIGAGQLEEGARIADRFIELSGYDEERCWSALHVASAYENRGDDAQMLRWTFRGFEITHNSFEVLYALTRVFHRRAMKTASRADWKRCAEFGKMALATPSAPSILFNSPVTRAVDIHDVLNVALNEIGDVSGARDSAAKVVAARPNNTNAAFNLRLYERHIGTCEVQAVLDRLVRCGANTASTRDRILALLGSEHPDPRARGEVVTAPVTTAPAPTPTPNQEHPKASLPAPPVIEARTESARIGTVPESGKNPITGADGWHRWWLDDRILIGGSIADREDGKKLRTAYDVGALASVESERDDSGKDFDGPDERIHLPFPDWGEPIAVPLLHQLLDYAQARWDEGKTLYVKCQQGCSRSPAMGYLIARGVLRLTADVVLARIRKVIPSYGSHESHKRYLASVEAALLSWRKGARCDRYGLHYRYPDRNGNLAHRHWVTGRLSVGGSFTSRADYERARGEFGVSAVVCVANNAAPDPSHGVERMLFRPFPDNGEPIAEALLHEVFDYAADVLKEPDAAVHVQCALGASRSPSVAYGIARAVLGMDAEEITRRLRATLPEFQKYPKYTESVERAVASWKRPSAHVTPSASPRNSSPRSLRIAFACGDAWEDWNPVLAAERGIGGSETAVIAMSKCLAAMGHDVSVISRCGEEGTYDGVRYLLPHRMDAIDCDVQVAWRYAEHLERGRAKARVLWVHDIRAYNTNNARLLRADRVLGLSEWHRRHLIGEHRIAPAHVLRTRNGIDLARFDQVVDRQPHKAVCSSSPDRYLPVLLELWPKVRATIPDAEVHIFYGFVTWRAMARNNPDQLRLCNALEDRMRDMASLGVHYRGRVDQKTLAREFLSAGVWTYPTWFTETSCISAMEAHAAGLRMVTSSIAALNETVAWRGRLIDGDWLNPGYQQAFADAVIQAMNRTDDADRRELQSYARANFSWQGVAAEWDALFHQLVANRVRGTLAPFRGAVSP